MFTLMFENLDVVDQRDTDTTEFKQTCGPIESRQRRALHAQAASL